MTDAIDRAIAAQPGIYQGPDTHQLTMRTPDGDWRIQGTCSCGNWTFTSGTADFVAVKHQAHTKEATTDAG